MTTIFTQLTPSWLDTLTPGEWLAVFIVLAIAINVAGHVYSRHRKKGRHHFRVKQSKQVLRAIHGINSWQQQLGYLRKINAYTFEELILTSLAAQGVKIQRNKRYSNDGGIDGRATLDGIPMLIQAKRYQSFVSTQHVQDFVALCKQEHCVGLFIHTGRTPKAAFEAVRGSHVVIVSGPKLIELLTVPSMLRNNGAGHHMGEETVEKSEYRSAPNA
ncbi:Restriction endonuclease [compost metagenome]